MKGHDLVLLCCGAGEEVGESEPVRNVFRVLALLQFVRISRTTIDEEISRGGELSREYEAAAHV